MTSSQLEVIGLACERNEKQIFSNLSFSLLAGQILQISGENGAGKSTLLRILATLLRPTEGIIRWRGSLASMTSSYSKNLLYLGHKRGIKEELTPLENWEFFMQMHGVSKKNSIEKILEELNLHGYQNTVCSLLSAGQKQRVQLGQLLLSDKMLWLLDEPYSYLDSVGIDLVSNLLITHRNQGGIVVFSSHLPVFVQQDFNIELKIAK